MAGKAKAPAIRFKGFSDAWEQRKLGEIGVTFTGLSGKTKEDFGHGEGKYVTYMNVFSNVIADGSAIEAVEIDKRQNEVRYGDAFFTTSSETPEEVGTTSVWLEKSTNTYLNSFCFGYRPLEIIDSYYMAYMLRSTEIRKKITFLAQGISRYNISKNRVMEVAVPIPDIEEQARIGVYFKQLDNRIKLQQRKYEKLQNVKKAMLEKMFPKNGSNVPEIRFAGFTDAWVRRKVGEFTNVGSAARVHKEEWMSSGIPFFRSSDVVSSYQGTENMKAFISYELYEQLVRVSGKLEKDDILITGGGSIGIPYIVPNNEPLYSKDADLIWVKSSEKFNSRYLYTYFTSPEFRKYLRGISHIGTIAHYTIEQVKETPICLPSIDEQNKIGTYFIHLDNLITLQQRKLEKLQNVKKACLEKMFI